MKTKISEKKSREEEYYEYCNKVQYDTFQHSGQPCIEDAIEWADSNPSDETIKKVVKKYLFGYRLLDSEEQNKSNYWDYIKEHWNE